jgi:hypothetical protein
MLRTNRKSDGAKQSSCVYRRPLKSRICAHSLMGVSLGNWTFCSSVWNVHFSSENRRPILLPPAPITCRPRIAPRSLIECR